MSRNTKIVIALLLVAVAAVGLFGYLASIRRAKQTATTMATVVDAARKAKRGTDDTVVTLSYRVGTTPAQGQARVTGVHLEDYPAGRQIPICYDPADIGSLRIRTDGCG